jgi:hypothetical protein
LKTITKHDENNPENDDENFKHIKEAKRDLLKDVTNLEGMRKQVEEGGESP